MRFSLGERCIIEGSLLIVTTYLVLVFVTVQPYSTRTVCFYETEQEDAIKKFMQFSLQDITRK